MGIGPLTTPIAVIDKTPTGIDFAQAALTAFFAVVSGFILYAIKTYIDETWLRKRRDFKRLKADIACTLITYGNVYGSDLVNTELRIEASKALRNCAGRLSSFVEEWPKNTKGIPQREDLKKASSEMVRLASCVYSRSDTYHISYNGKKAMDRIRVLVGLQSTE